MRNVISLAIVLVLISVGSAIAVEIKVDWGSKGTLEASWTEWSATSGSKTVDGVQFTLSNTGLNNGPKLRPWLEGVGDKLIVDCLSAEDEPSGGSYTLQITNLAAGDYEMVTYHNMGDAQNVGTSTATLDAGHGGTSDTTNTGYHVASYTDLNEATGLTILSFTSSGTSDTVTITYTHTGDMPALAGFTLTLAGPMIQFAADSSGDLETVSPAVLEVVMSKPEAGQTYTVDYTAVGGTAAKDDDYTITEPGTLAFIPGDTSETIIIDIIDDGLDEDDETIIVELSNPTGPAALLGGRTRHTYTIRDPRPQVTFDANTTRNTEYAGLANIPVSLSWAPIETVTVDYEVTGGTATGGGVDYTLEPGTLTFNPGETTKSVCMVIVNDGIGEEHETVIITLSNPAHAHLGSRSVHTSTIIGPNTVHFRMDIALPEWEGTEQVPDWEGVPIPGTLKDGWISWCAGRWSDMYGHGTTAVEDIAGTGVSTMTSTVYGGLTAVKVCGMCMPELNGGTAPYGSPSHDPICNSWMQVEDHPENPSGDIVMALYNLPAGEYELYSYHNNFECHRGDPTPEGTSACCDLTGIPQPNMPSITALSIDGLLEHYAELDGWARWEDTKRQFISCQEECFWDHPVGSLVGNNVTTTQAAYNVPIQQVTSDDDLVPSLIKFRTDSSAVFIVYVSGCCVPDGIRPARVGGRAILNAFELKLTKPGEPTQAYKPSPEDGAGGVHPNVELGWKPGSRAGLHEVYLGDSFEAVRDATTSSPEHKATLAVGEMSYIPGSLTMGKTYYWRVDEVNEGEAGSPWKGDVWSFTLLDHFVVDDFEDYTELGLIETWIDGWVTMDNGAVVWLGLPPAPVRDLQSLLYDFDNSGARNGFYSQAYRHINEPNDWTMFGVKVLKMWFYGDPVNTLVDTDYFCVGVEDTSGSGSYSEVRYGDSNDMNDLKVAEWHEWNIDLEALAGESLNLEDVNKLYIIIGDKQNPVAGGGGGVYIDDIWLFGVPSAVYPECWDYLTQCHGDCDNTGDVKGSDFLALKNSWYKVYPDAAYDPCADFDRDGQVKGSDFLILKDNWYQTVDPNCPPGGTWAPQP